MAIAIADKRASFKYECGLSILFDVIPPTLGNSTISSISGAFVALVRP